MSSKGVKNRFLIGLSLALVTMIASMSSALAWIDDGSGGGSGGYTYVDHTYPINTNAVCGDDYRPFIPAGEIQVNMVVTFIYADNEIIDFYYDYVLIEEASWPVIILSLIGPADGRFRKTKVMIPEARLCRENNYTLFICGRKEKR